VVELHVQAFVVGAGQCGDLVTAGEIPELDSIALDRGQAGAVGVERDDRRLPFAGQGLDVLAGGGARYR
jgi:hypothetical protein